MCNKFCTNDSAFGKLIRLKRDFIYSTHTASIHRTSHTAYRSIAVFYTHIRHSEMTKSSELIMTSGKTSATGILCDRIITVSLNWYALSSFGMYFYYYCTQCITYPIQLPTTAAATTAMATIDSLAAQNKCCAMHTLKRIKKRKSISVQRNRWTSASNVDCVMVNERETMALQHKTRHHKNRPSQLFSREEKSQAGKSHCDEQVFLFQFFVCNMSLNGSCWWLHSIVPYDSSRKSKRKIHCICNFMKGILICGH